MILYPAIDLKDGQCVRLIQGDFAQKTVYDPDPAAVARRWQDMGASYLHLVDLDGAHSGTGRNLDAVKRIREAVTIPMQLGGGIRTADDVRSRLDMGVTRVILGTAALENPSFARDMVKAYGKRIAVGVDAVNGLVAVSAWRTVSQTKAVDFLRDLVEMGVQTVIYTDISKDGMMSGPNYAMYREAVVMGGLEIIASGGVSAMEDLTRLQEAGVPGAIIGKALYENAIDLREAVQKYAG